MNTNGYGETTEETAAAPLCKDRYTPHVLISKATVCDGPQIKWVGGQRRDHHWPEVKAQDKTGGQGTTLSFPLEA